MWIYVVLGCLIVLPAGCDASANQVLTEPLADYLLTNYSTHLLPVCQVNSNVTLNMDMALRQIMELNEREQILSTNVWLRLRWNDCRLVWNSTAFDNITYLTVTYNDIWTPDITLYDSAAEEEMMPGRPDYRATISSSGSVTYNFPTVIKSVCRVDVRYFPFDTQRCKLKFGSWSHHGLEVDVVNRNPGGDLASYILNSEWIVESLPVERTVAYYSCCDEPYPDVTYVIVMRRRPDFYLLTMIFPCMLTSVVAAVSFLLPVESGEKVSLTITVLLSMAVFLLLVSESMPPSSDNFPIVGMYFAVSMGLVSLSCLMIILVLNVFYRGTNGRRVPAWAKVVFFQYLGRALCIRHNQVSGNDPPRTQRTATVAPHTVIDWQRRDEDSQPKSDDLDGGDPMENGTNGRNGIPSVPIGMLPHLPFRDPLLNNIKEQTKSLKVLENTFQEKHAEDDVNSEWRDLANVLDRLFFVLYCLVCFTVTMALLMQCV